MIKIWSAVILLSLLVPGQFSLAQETSPGSVKIYSGYLHQYNTKSGVSLWHALFGTPSHKEERVLEDRPCSIEFKSAGSFSNQPVSVIPKSLTYLIRFKNPSFKKFIIKIYTDTEDEYDLNPEAEGKQVGINDEHHIYDAYLIYLVLGTTIDHLEIINPLGKGDNQDKYVLDRLEVHEN